MYLLIFQKDSITLYLELSHDLTLSTVYRIIILLKKYFTRLIMLPLTDVFLQVHAPNSQTEVEVGSWMLVLLDVVTVEEFS